MHTFALYICILFRSNVPPLEIRKKKHLWFLSLNISVYFWFLSSRSVRECKRRSVQHEGLFHICCIFWEWQRPAVGHQTAGPLWADVHCPHWPCILLWLAPWWQVKEITLWLKPTKKCEVFLLKGSYCMLLASVNYVYQVVRSVLCLSS